MSHTKPTPDEGDQSMTYGKGVDSTFRPDAGTKCLISGPNCDDIDGYTFEEYDILWRNETFLLYGIEGCWPNLHKWDYVIARPVSRTEKGDQSMTDDSAKTEQELRGVQIYLLLTEMAELMGVNDLSGARQVNTSITLILAAMQQHDETNRRLNNPSGESR
jgi:hypothetical protein